MHSSFRELFCRIWEWCSATMSASFIFVSSIIIMIFIACVGIFVVGSLYVVQEPANRIQNEVLQTLHGRWRCMVSGSEYTFTLKGDEKILIFSEKDFLDKQIRERRAEIISKDDTAQSLTIKVLEDSGDIIYTLAMDGAAFSLHYQTDRQNALFNNDHPDSMFQRTYRRGRMDYIGTVTGEH